MHSAKVETLVQFLRFPSISTNPELATDVVRCAEQVFARLSRPHTQ